MNLVGYVMADSPDPDQKGIAKGFIELMQWIQISIQKRDELLDKERIKHEAKNVSEGQEEQGK
jgi:imidazolonepropionase-like amidohydrolase